MDFLPSRASLTGHPVPGWFERAKLGIFVHWGLYSVPGWAPAGGTLNEVTRRQGWRYWFAHNPYAEWYWNSLRLAGSPTRAFHDEHYGSGFAYEDFRGLFERGAKDWQADEWAELFAQAGARYVVMVSKHHDGYLLWPSSTPNPRKDGWQSQRDYLAELAQASRARGMEFGLYYSGGLDWTFEPGPVASFGGLLDAIPSSREYSRYAESHWRELIDRCQPKVLWNDIGFPAGADLNQLFADYYNRFPDGLFNDRFNQVELGGAGSLRRKITTGLANVLVPLALRLSNNAALPSSAHSDFLTPEYAVFPKQNPKKWESTRGLGLSFGYNRRETEADYIPVENLVHLFIDIVSKGGNLLLNVGPDGSGRIPHEQRARLEGLGAWLAVNGEAIYATRPWLRAEGSTAAGLPLRFTARDGQVYAIVLGQPSGNWVRLSGVSAQPGSTINLLGRVSALHWQQEAGGLAIELPPLAPSPAYTFRFSPLI